jgi:hypothetical protein
MPPNIAAHSSRRRGEDPQRIKSTVAPALVEIAHQRIEGQQGRPRRHWCPGGILAGVTKPCRTRLAITWSADIVAEDPAGTIAATTRLRSVTSTVSPAAAARIYSLSLFFRVLRPTMRIIEKVAPGS